MAARPASSPAATRATSRSSRPGTGDPGAGRTESIVRPAVRVGVVAGEQRLVLGLAHGAGAERRARPPGRAGAAARAVSAPAIRPGGCRRLARAARAQHEHVGGAVGERRAERDRRRQPGVDAAAGRRARPAARRAAAARPRRAARAAATARRRSRRAGRPAAPSAHVGGDRVQLGPRSRARRRTARARAARSARSTSVARRPPAAPRSARRRLDQRAHEPRVDPGRDPVAARRPLTSHIAFSAPAEEP